MRRKADKFIDQSSLHGYPDRATNKIHCSVINIQPDNRKSDSWTAERPRNPRSLREHYCLHPTRCHGNLRPQASSTIGRQPLRIPNHHRPPRPSGWGSAAHRSKPYAAWVSRAAHGGSSRVSIPWLNPSGSSHKRSVWPRIKSDGSVCRRGSLGSVRHSPSTRRWKGDYTQWLSVPWINAKQCQCQGQASEVMDSWGSSQGSSAFIQASSALWGPQRRWKMDGKSMMLQVDSRMQKKKKTRLSYSHQFTIVAEPAGSSLSVPAWQRLDRGEVKVEPSSNLSSHTFCYIVIPRGMQLMRKSKITLPFTHKNRAQDVNQTMLSGTHTVPPDMMLLRLSASW